MINPFVSTSPLNAQLPLEKCCDIHFAALFRVLNSSAHWVDIPDILDLQTLAAQVREHGWEVCLFHPDHVAELFRTISLDVYKTIKQLYCARLCRTVPMVHRIIQAMAHDAAIASPPYEAVWSICSHLFRLRKKGVAFQIEQQNTTWLAVTLKPDVTMRDHTGQSYTLAIICIIDTKQDAVVSYQFAQSGDVNRAIHFALYLGFAIQQVPEQLTVVGLRWRIPEKAIIPEICDDALESDLAQLGITTCLQADGSREDIAILHHLRSDWTRDLRTQPLGKQQFGAIFDNLLFRWQGTGPQWFEHESQRQYANLVGYNQEPAALVAALRDLLPAATGTIEEGSIKYDGLYYENELLNYCVSHSWMRTA